MTYPDSHINLYPELDDELDAAYAAAQYDQAKGAGVATVAAAVIEERKSYHSLELLDDAALEILGWERTMAEATYDHIGLRMPSLQEFAEQGVDFGKINDAFNVMRWHQLVPFVVMAPVLDQQRWEALYASLAADPEVSDSVYALNHDGMMIPPEVWEAWQDINTTGHEVTIDNEQWQVLVMPTVSESHQQILPRAYHDGRTEESPQPGFINPEIFDLTRELGIFDVEVKTADLHPTAAAMLGVQAMRLAGGTTPLDGKYWLRGSFTVAAGQPKAGEERMLWAYWHDETAFAPDTSVDEQRGPSIVYDHPDGSEMQVRVTVWGKDS